MMKPAFLSGAACLLLLASCAPPTTTVVTVDARPRVQFANAAPTETLYIDGTPLGAVTAFAAPGKVLALDHGTHVIEVRNANQIIYSQSVYLGEDMTKTIQLPSIP